MGLQALRRGGQAFLHRVFTPAEEAYAQARPRTRLLHLAGRFAAKEAVFKAFGDGVVKGADWKDIEIQNNKNGKPIVILSGGVEKLRLKRKIKEVIISLSHTRNYATATAILIGNSKS